MKLCLATSILVPLALSACAHQATTPKELLDARAEYARARDGIAMRLDPTDVHEAWAALQRAETANRDAPGEATSVDLAVVADRKALLAQSEAEGLEARQLSQQANASLQQTRMSQLRAAQAQVQQMQQQAGATEMQSQQTQEMQSRLREARESVSRIPSASVRDDERGMIITVQSEVLFNTGKFALRPAAVAKLDQIADALHGIDQPIEVFGYTDSTGTRARNMELSQDRARVVRDYLVSRGIPKDLIKAQGKGPEEPVSENATVEGRALNRRVEIVVEPSKQQQGATSPQPRGPDQNTWQQNNVGQPRK
jgi:outer membrane protein OmpA-like peptidoglycan-associated protein